LLQTGSWATLASGGSPTYQLWVEDYPAHAAGFCSNPVSSGDIIKPSVYSATIVGGPSGSYYVQTYDSTNGWVCSTSPNPYPWEPPNSVKWAYFMLEIPIVNTYWHADLPYFSPSFNFQGRVYYDGAYHPITDPYNNGWGVWYKMVNNNVLNICSGWYIVNTCNQQVNLIGSYGQFTNTWITSQYT
jgi:hypothetical protein